MSILPQDILDELEFRKKCEERREKENEEARKQFGKEYREIRYTNKYGHSFDEDAGL